VSDKRLLERCGTEKGYLNETRTGSVRPPGPRLIPGVQKIDETGNVLSEIESQGFRKQKGFGLELN
jgi:hypothetical protein